MFEHIAVALDLSPAADSMLRCLPSLRELGTRRLTLVHVAEVEYPVFGGVAHLDRHRERLASAAASLEEEGFTVNVVAGVGSPAAEILKAAGAVGASMVMVGSRSHSRVREAFVGSVASEVTRRATLPVLVQRIEPQGEDGPPVASCFDRTTEVLVPTDFSQGAERALPLVESLVRAGLRSVTLLHVRGEEAAEGGSFGPAGRDGLEGLAERLREGGAGAVQVVVTTGKVADEILRQAGLHSQTLIVMGTHGRGRAARAVLGSVSREVLREAPGWVLLAPPRA